jgi:hypothetical protein
MSILNGDPKNVDDMAEHIRRLLECKSLPGYAEAADMWTRIRTNLIAFIEYDRAARGMNGK